MCIYEHIHVGSQYLYGNSKPMFELQNDFDVAELESLTIERRLLLTKPIILMTVYRPEGPVQVYNDIHNLISNILFEDKEFIMMGDVNANLLSKPLDNDAKHMENMENFDLIKRIQDTHQMKSGLPGKQCFLMFSVSMLLQPPPNQKQ